MFPVCLVTSKKYLSDYFAPARKVKKDNFSCAFFVRLPNSNKVHIVAPASAVSEASHIYLEIDEEMGQWLRCRASVKNAFGAFNVAILELSDSDSAKNARFMSIAEQRALPLFANTVTLEGLLTAEVFSSIPARGEAFRCTLVFHGLKDTMMEFSHHTTMTLICTSETELLLGAPYIAVVHEQPYILGLHLNHDGTTSYGLPWVLLNVVLQADLQNIPLRGISSPLILLQEWENELDRRCSGLKDYRYGARVKKVFPESRLAEHVKPGDILLKVNGEQVSMRKTIYDKSLQQNFRFSFMTFNAALPNATIELEFGRPRALDVTKADYTLDTFSVKVLNDRTTDDCMASRDCSDHSLLVVSGFPFIAVARYKLADYQNYAEEHAPFFKKHLQYFATETCQQIVFLGDLPQVYEAEHHERYQSNRVTQVDGKGVSNFEEFKAAINENLQRGAKGVTITLVPVENESERLLRGNELGSDIYIKHQTLARNQEIGQKMGIPFKFFAIAPSAEEELKRKQATFEMRM